MALPNFTCTPTKSFTDQLNSGPLALGHGRDSAGLLHGPARPHLEVLDPVLDARPPELLVAPLAVPVGALLGKGVVREDREKAVVM